MTELKQEKKSLLPQKPPQRGKTPRREESQLWPRRLIVAMISSDCGALNPKKQPRLIASDVSRIARKTQISLIITETNLKSVLPNISQIQKRPQEEQLRVYAPRRSSCTTPAGFEDTAGPARSTPVPGRASFLVMRDVGMYCFALCIPDDSLPPPPHHHQPYQRFKNMCSARFLFFFFFFLREEFQPSRDQKRRIWVWLQETKSVHLKYAHKEVWRRRTIRKKAAICWRRGVNSETRI